MTPPAISEKYGSSTWCTTRPTVELAPPARVRAYGLATYPSSRETCRTRLGDLLADPVAPGERAGGGRERDAGALGDVDEAQPRAGLGHPTTPGMIIVNSVPLLLPVAHATL